MSERELSIDEYIKRAQKQRESRRSAPAVAKGFVAIPQKQLIAMVNDTRKDGDKMHRIFVERGAQLSQYVDKGYAPVKHEGDYIRLDNTVMVEIPQEDFLAGLEEVKARSDFMLRGSLASDAANAQAIGGEKVSITQAGKQAYGTKQLSDEEDVVSAS